MENENMNERGSLYKKAWEKISKYKTLGIIASIIMIILGACLFFNPFGSDAILVILLVIGMLINGIQKIFLYFKMDKAVRDGWQLALGIIWIVVSIVLLSTLLFTIATLTIMAGLLMGMTAIINGISDFTNIRNAEAMGRSKGLMILSGILLVLVGLVMFCRPLLTTIVVTIFYGAFMLILGISLLIRCLSITKPKDGVQ